NDASIIPTSTQHLASLTLNNSTRMIVGTNGSRVIRLSSLTMSPDAILDLFDNNLLLQATLANRQAMLDLITSLARSGRNDGAWNGKGIRSAIAANNALHSTGLAVELNDRGNGSPIVAQFLGETTDTNSILGKYTYNGDGNLDGQVNADDYAQIDAGYATGATGYFNGDFTLSGGPPNSDDYFLIDKAYSDQAAPLSSPQAPAAQAAASSDPIAGGTSSTSTSSA